MSSHPVPVVIVGAGPTGLTAATLLAQYGIECLVLERQESIYPQPRAVHLDDEVYRIIARMGLGSEFAAISWPCHGLRLIDRRGMRVLNEFERDAADGQHGYPEANMFDQPELEAMLRVNLRRHETATILCGLEVTGLAQNATDLVRVETADRRTGRKETILAQYVLGCDGANSSVRSLIGATIADLRFEQRWLVVDVATHADLAEWEGVHQVCDAAQAATYMRIGETRYRWEFRLAPGESVEQYRDLHALHSKLAPWTKAIPIEDLELVRAAEYTFHAQLAESWRRGRVFLLGDAAHLTPPFVGQGMGAGMRDAMNLAWKLAAVLGGSLPESTLDSYETERKPHARALIRLAKVIGTAMTGGGETGNLIRSVVAPHLHRLPGLKQQVLNSETPPLRRSELVVRPRLRRSLAGRLCPNAPLGDGRRFDDVAGGRFAIVATSALTRAQLADAEQRGAVVLTAEPRSALHRWLRRGQATAVVVRPDGAVLRAGHDISALCAALPRFVTDIALSVEPLADPVEPAA